MMKISKSETFVYLFEGTPYINLTNRCSNDCAFCVRQGADGIGQESLWLSREPRADEVIEQLSVLLSTLSTRPTGIVFCGYGEPTYRMAELLEVAGFAHSQQLTTRLNTNGLGSLINNRDITDELSGAIDMVSVSLNASDAAQYEALCRPQFGKESFKALLDFSKKCTEKGIKTILSVVDSIPSKEIETCRQIAANLGTELRIRKLIESSS